MHHSNTRPFYLPTLTKYTVISDKEEELVRPYECMDISCNGRVLCAGSQLVEDDAYLVFWDNRLPKPLGGYWNSHTEDITQVNQYKNKEGIPQHSLFQNIARL